MAERHFEGKFRSVASTDSRGRTHLAVGGEKRKNKWSAIPFKNKPGGTVQASLDHRERLIQVGIRTRSPHTPTAPNGIEKSTVKLRFPTADGFRTAKRAMREALNPRSSKPR